MMKIRLAEEKDWPGIAALHYHSFIAANQGLLSAQLMQHPDLTEKNFELTWQKRSAEFNKTMLTLIAEEHGQPIGFATLIDLLNKEKSPELKFFYIHPDHWRKKIGTQLFIHLAEQLIELNHNRLTICALHNYEPSTFFYCSLGAQALRVKTITLLKNDPTAISSVEVTEFSLPNIKNSLSELNKNLETTHSDNHLKNFSESNPIDLSTTEHCIKKLSELIPEETQLQKPLLPKTHSVFFSDSKEAPTQQWIVVDIDTPYASSDDENDVTTSQSCCRMM